MKAHQTVNMIFVETTLLNAWQSNYSYVDQNKIFLLITSEDFTKLIFTLKMWLKASSFLVRT